MNNLSGYGVFEIAGEKLPFKFGVNAYALFCQYRGVDLDKIATTGLYGEYDSDGKPTKDPDVKANIELAYFAYQTACQMKGEDTRFNLITFQEMMQEEYDVLVKLFTLNLESKLMGRTLTEIAQDETKKKNQLNGAKS